MNLLFVGYLLIAVIALGLHKRRYGRLDPFAPSVWFNFLFVWMLLGPAIAYEWFDVYGAWMDGAYLSDALLFGLLCFAAFWIGYYFFAMRPFSPHSPQPLEHAPSASVDMLRLRLIALILLVITWSSVIASTFGYILPWSGSIARDEFVYMERDIGSWFGSFGVLAWTLGPLALTVYVSQLMRAGYKWYRSPIVWGYYLIGLLLLINFGGRNQMIEMSIAIIIAFHYGRRRLSSMQILLLGCALVFANLYGLWGRRSVIGLGGVYASFSDIPLSLVSLRNTLLTMGPTELLIVGMKLVPLVRPHDYGLTILLQLNPLPTFVFAGGRGYTGWFKAQLLGPGATTGIPSPVIVDVYMSLGWILGPLLFFVPLGRFYRWLYEKVLREETSPQPQIFPVWLPIYVFLAFDTLLMWHSGVRAFSRLLIYAALGALLVRRVCYIQEYHRPLTGPYQAASMQQR